MLCRCVLALVVSVVVSQVRWGAMVAKAYQRKMAIVAGVHVGLITAALASEQAKACGEAIHITVFEENQENGDTTAVNMWNSHADGEIASVVRRRGTANWC